MTKPRSRKTTPTGAPPAAARVDWRSKWESLKAAAVRDAWHWMMIHPGARCYLYYEPAQGPRWGSFYVVPEGENDQQPPGIVPVQAETVPQGDQTAIARWLERYAGQLPMIGGE